MNSEKVNAAIAQLNEAQGSLRKHDAIRAIEAGNIAEAIEILEDEGVEGFKLAVGSDQVRAIAEARKALYEALTETNTIETIVSEFKASFEGSERQQEIRRTWGMVAELAYTEAVAWMDESLLEKVQIETERFRKVYGKRGKSQGWIEANIRDAIVRGLEVEEHFLWLAELAQRTAPNDKAAQRWMIS